MVARGSEQLAGLSAICFLRTFASSLSSEPTSPVIRDVYRQYERVFGTDPWPKGRPSSVPTGVVHRLFVGIRSRPPIDWRCYNPPIDELVPIARALVQVARFKYDKRDYEIHKVPRWLIRFALHFLSQDPLPPISVVVDCLIIIATDLGCVVSDINGTELDEKWVRIPKMSDPSLTLP